MFKGPAGLPAMMKEGAAHYKGKEEATLRLIDAAGKLASTLRTSFGPTGNSKLITSHIEKLFWTSDAATILTELEVFHPAARLLAMNCQRQNQEFGDHTNYVIMMASALLEHAGELIERGVPMSNIIEGYQAGLTSTLGFLNDLKPLKNMRGADANIIRPLVTSKMPASDVEWVTELIVKACEMVISANDEAMDSDNVRVCKITGGSMADARVLNGMVLARQPRTTVKNLENCKIIVLGTALEGVQTEATSTVLVEDSTQMKDFTKGEEEEMENLIKGWVDKGVRAIVCGGNISALALHYLNKYELFAIPIASRFDIKRIARTLRVPALQRANVGLTAEEIGMASSISVEEIGSQMVTVIQAKDTRVATVLVRGALSTSLDEVERAIEDCVSCIGASLKDDRFLPGGGSTETALAIALRKNSDAQVRSLSKYAIGKFSDALESIPRTIAENAGHDALETLSRLREAHSQAAECSMGVDVTKATAGIRDLTQQQGTSPLGFPVWDHLVTKEWALRLAMDAVMTILKVDQIIMAKPAGGPKLPTQGHWDAADDRQPNF